MFLILIYSNVPMLNPIISLFTFLGLVSVRITDINIDPFMPEFTLEMFINSKPRIVSVILYFSDKDDLKWYNKFKKDIY